jgi:hypothetical protein
MQRATELQLQRDATFWSLPRARLRRVLGRRIRVPAIDQQLDRALIIFFRAVNAGD